MNFESRNLRKEVGLPKGFDGWYPGREEEEINELKSNIGLISIDSLRENLKERA